MANKMLIDATHPEETRVVVLRGNRVEEFDFEAANRKQLRGNIYLAKVTRVEPSLQAAFVDYGGNRHGFLAFSEIHPDYYQIPVADRQALLEEERLRHRSEDDYEPVDDEADFQEIEEIDDEDPDENGDQPEEDTKPRKSRSSRGRTSRGRGGREKNRAASSDDADAAGTGKDAPEATGSVETSAADTVLETSSDPVPSNGSAASDTGPVESGTPGESESATDEDEKPAKPVPDRFLAASDDDDAVISGELPLDATRKPNESEVAGDDIEGSSESGETTLEAESETASDAPVADADEAVSEDGSATAPPTDGDVEAAELSVEDAETGEPASADGPRDGTVDEPESEAAAAPDDQQSDDTESEAVQEIEAEDDQAAPAKARRNQRSSEAAPSRPRRRYKIQEVIKRRQIILVQVVKEERGTKGAALTTYLSLAGRYSVLMPNSARGGGISRKITNPGDRKRLKTIANELPVPEGMGVILRTAGASRTKTEVKRDFEYLMRLWENVRDLTLQSSAPALVYEEGNLVKRSIRDLYNKDIDEVQVAGDIGYREAKDFMRMLMPSHAKNVQPYKDQVPIFAKNRVEPQLDAMFLPRVTLPSGGYIIINQTEALVAVDVNSGKATREHNIEDTALRTNVEAAEEMARQLRLRDLAGLIVIDFIDMEEKRNNRTVERKLKDCLKSDRARIQVGRISHFGLLEMSRQRLRTGVLESSTELCPHCHGTGVIRSTESVALHVLRTIEDQLLRSASHNLSVRIRTEIALYIINNKRYSLTDMEGRYGVQLNLAADETIEEAYCIIERDGVAESRRAPPSEGPGIVQPDTIDPDEVPDESSDAEAEEVVQQDEEDGAPKKRRRKRRRRGKDSDNTERTEPSDDNQADVDAQSSETDSDAGSESESGPESADAKDDNGAKKRRRGRRGGRRNKRTDGETTAQDSGEQTEEVGDGEPAAEANSAAPADEDTDSAPAMVATVEETGGNEVSVSQESAVETTSDEETTGSETGPSEDEKPGSEELVVEEPVVEEPVIEEPAPEILSMEPPAPEAPVEDDRPKKSGWWQKRSFFKS